MDLRKKPNPYSSYGDPVNGAYLNFFYEYEYTEKCSSCQISWNIAQISYAHSPLAICFHFFSVKKCNYTK